MSRLATALTLAAGTSLAASAHAQLQLTIDPTVRHQTIEGMGAAASVTWIQAVCDLYTDPTFAAQIRDDLGLTMMRIEIPPNFEPDEDLDPDTVDWTRFNFNTMRYTGAFAGLLNDASHPGAVKVLGTVWSPPWWMKTNGSETGGGHLRPDRYSHFGKFCAVATLGFPVLFGPPLDSISIQNEPVFAEPFTSCVYTPTEYRDTIHALAFKYAYWNIHGRIYGPEDTGGTDPSRLVSFVTTWQTDPVANQRMDAVALHQFPYLNEIRASSPTAWTTLKQQVAPKPLWVTEISGESDTWLDPQNELGGGLYVAREIHDALVYGDVTSWLYWSVTDPSTPSQTLMNLRIPNKKYYACKQFFRYVRPGAVRIDAVGGDSNVLVSAYVHDQQQTATVVLINQADTAQPVHLSLGSLGALSSFQTIRSTETEETAQLPATPVVNGQVDLTLPPTSIVTLYGSTCYANCDGGIVAPILNVGDFICFQTKFASGDPYANCDGSTTPPVLNVADFICFQMRFAAGCP